MGILLGSLILVTVGVIDDMKDLPAKVKLLFQIISALIVVFSGVGIKNSVGMEAICVETKDSKEGGMNNVND